MATRGGARCDGMTERDEDDEECIEDKLKASDFDRISAVFEVDVLPRDKSTTLRHSSSFPTCGWVHG